MDFNVASDEFKQKKDDKQPIRRPKRATPTVTTIVAKAVIASKPGNNQLIPVGKYGFALAGDVKLNYYQLLLYSSKNSVLSNLILTKSFEYIVNENNTVEFLSEENWHLEFANINDAVEFNSHLSFVLWKLKGSKELFWMDLYYPSRHDKVATFGNVVEITYVANTVHGKILGPEVSNNIKDDRYLKVNINEEGWERSLFGVNNKTRRIIYLPAAEMGAWKIFTDGRQCLCLTVTVKSVCEIREDIISDLPVITQEPLEFTKKDSDPIQLKEIVDNNLTIETVVPLKTVGIESLFQEFEKLKIDNIKTNERLTNLEALVKEKKLEKKENSGDLEFKKSMKTVYKSIIREFPVDQTFSGSQIQTIVKDIFYNALVCANQCNID